MTMQAGDVITPIPPAAFYHDDTTIVNIVDTTYVTGSPEVGVYFLAPTSGTVRITVGAGVRDNGGSNRDRLFISPAVYRVTPTGLEEVLAPSVTFRGYGGSEAVTEMQYGCRVSLLTGLTPGTQYYARIMYFTSSGVDPDTADINARDLIVIPMP